MSKNKRHFFYKIISSSMYPALNLGDIVISRKKNPEDIKVGVKDGDILIIRGPQYFYTNGVDPLMWNYLPNNTPIIHRAIDKKKIGGVWYFKTKGDNSWAPDGSFRVVKKTVNCISVEYEEGKIIYVPESEILGVVIKKIPQNNLNTQLTLNSDFFINMDMFERMEIKVYMKNKNKTK